MRFAAKLLMVICLFLTQSARAAEVVAKLMNGDQVTGVLILTNATLVVVSNAWIGKISIPANQISKVTPVPPPVAPVTAAVVAVKAAAPPPPAAVAPVAKVTPTMPVEPPWWRLLMTNWTGNIQVGLDLGIGTIERQLYYGRFQAGFARGRWRHNVDMSAAYGQNDKVVAANRMDGSVKTDFDILKGRRFYVYNLGAAGFDEVGKVDLKFQEGAGMGYKLYDAPKVFSKNDAMVVNVELGGQYQEFTYSTGLRKRDVSARFGEDFTWKVSPKLTLTERGAFIPNVADTSDYRVRLDAAVSYPLANNLSLSLAVVDEYHSKPPVRVKANDLQIHSTIGYRF